MTHSNAAHALEQLSETVTSPEVALHPWRVSQSKSVM
jgi:hypothetical protein